MKKTFVFVASLVFVIATLALIAWNLFITVDCWQSGGIPVRGAYSMVCI